MISFVFTFVYHSCYIRWVRLETLKYDGFDYDTGNPKKVRAHGVTLAEIDDFFNQELLIIEDLKHSINESRFIAVGLSPKRKRAMFVAFTTRIKRSEIYIRPISARYCHKKEAQIYETTKKDIQR